MTDNLALWNSVCETNPSHTKEVNFGRKITAIDPYQQIKAATAKFGPAGHGWGWEVMDVTYPPNDTVAVRVRLWHGSPEHYIEHWGQNGLFTYKKKSIDDKDCLKKATTDGITKCLSMLGFNADVFLGKFDDNKYVAEMRAKEAAQNEPTPTGPSRAEEMKSMAKGINNALLAAQNSQEVIDVWDANIDDINRLPPNWQEKLMATRDRFKAA